MEGETKLKDLNDAHKKSTEEMKAKHKQEIDELKQAMKALEAQVRMHFDYFGVVPLVTCSYHTLSILPYQSILLTTSPLETHY